MSHEIPGLPPRRVDPKLLRSKIDSLARKKQNAAKEEASSAVRPEDSVHLSSLPSSLDQKLEEVNLTYEELESYVALLKEEPDPEVDQEKVARVKRDLEAGRYGTEALQVTVDELMRDLGLR